MKVKEDEDEDEDEDESRINFRMSLCPSKTPNLQKTVLKIELLYLLLRVDFN